MSLILRNLQAVHARIDSAAHSAARDPQDVILLAVSKTFGADAVIEAALAGQVAFGENYLQEALDKMDAVRAVRPEAPIEWHFVGPIQSNKTRAIAAHFDWVHSVERLSIAERLSLARPAHLPPLNVCLQVNISGEGSKSGASPDEAPALARAIADLPRLHLRGLMAIPAATEDEQQQRAAFKRLRELQESLCNEGLALDTLSMGMSGDLDAAIAEGATIVRVGSAIFGNRNHAR